MTCAYSTRSRNWKTNRGLSETNRTSGCAANTHDWPFVVVGCILLEPLCAVATRRVAPIYQTIIALLKMGENKQTKGSHCTARVKSPIPSLPGTGKGHRHRRT